MNIITLKLIRKEPHANTDIVLKWYQELCKSSFTVQKCALHMRRLESLLTIKPSTNKPKF